MPSAASLCLDLLFTLRGGSMPVRALVDAGGLFGLSENNVRVSLSRLCRAGRIERDERGRYRLGPRSSAVSEQVGGWRHLERLHVAWKGRWVAVHAASRGRGPARRRRERALALLGFRELEPGLCLRPDNLRLGVAGVRERLGVLAEGPVGVVCALDELGADDERRALALWDASSLQAGYRAGLAALARSVERLAQLPPEAAMVESFRVGGGEIRRLARDPLLPAPIVDPAPRAELVRALRRYDAAGRASWADFMAAHDVHVRRELPVDWRREPGLASAPSEGVAA